MNIYGEKRMIDEEEEDEDWDDEEYPDDDYDDPPILPILIWFKSD
jgi:hypothetical protein